MPHRLVSALVGLLFTIGLAAPAAAGMTPYVRLDYGGSELRTSAIDDNIASMEQASSLNGDLYSFQSVGSGYGPSVALGAWLTPRLRVGATFAYHHAVRENWATHDSSYAFDDQLDFREHEIGAEAAMRFTELHGFMFGVNVAQGHADYAESTTLINGGALQLTDGKASGNKITYGAFVGIDQAAASGAVGYIRFGYQFRDFGQLPAIVTTGDGFTSTAASATTTRMDLGGFYLRVGMGFDLAR